MFCGEEGGASAAYNMRHDSSFVSASGTIGWGNLVVVVSRAEQSRAEQLDVAVCMHACCCWIAKVFVSVSVSLAQS